MEIWPNFFIVGAPRSGTTSLSEYLKKVEGVYMSPVKEPNYFSVSINLKHKLSKPLRNKDEYLSLFSKAKNAKAIGEASPTYLWDPKTPKLIHDAIPTAKIIMILRDPVERSFSHYLNGIGLGYETLPFIEAMKEALKKDNDYSGRIATTSFYTDSVSKYLDTFGKNNVKIIIFEEFFKDVKTNFKEILNFLGIYEDTPTMDFSIHNEFSIPRGKVSEILIKNKFLRNVVKNLVPREKGVKLRAILTKNVTKPQMTKEEHDFAKNIYFDDVKKLEKLLGKRLPWSTSSDE